MTDTIDLFSPANLAASVEIPAAPVLVPHEYPFPGISPEDSARSGIAMSSEHADMLAAVIKRYGGRLTDGQALALVPADWRALLGKWAHGHLAHRQAEQRGIVARYCHHDDGGCHFDYEPVDEYGPAMQEGVTA